MSKNEPRDPVAAVVYISFGLILVISYVVLNCHDLVTTGWVWIALGGGIVYLTFTGFHAVRRPLTPDPCHERELLKWITQYLAAFVLAVTLVMLIGFEISKSSEKAISDIPALSAFYCFEFLALGFIFLFVLPTYWFGGNEQQQKSWLKFGRHLKTAGYLVAISFCLAGFIELANHLLVAN